MKAAATACDDKPDSLLCCKVLWLMGWFPASLNGHTEQEQKPIKKEPSWVWQILTVLQICPFSLSVIWTIAIWGLLSAFRGCYCCWFYFLVVVPKICIRYPAVLIWKLAFIFYFLFVHYDTCLWPRTNNPLYFSRYGCCFNYPFEMLYVACCNYTLPVYFVKFPTELRNCIVLTKTSLLCSPH